LLLGKCHRLVCLVSYRRCGRGDLGRRFWPHPQEARHAIYRASTEMVEEACG